MSKISDFFEYKKHQPEYKDWKEDRDNQVAKKVSYIKTNPIKADEFNKEIERAKIVLNAVNVMDEHSQSRAEDMEEVAIGVENALVQIGTYAGMGLGALTLYLTNGAKGFEELGKLITGQKSSILKLIPAGVVTAVSIIGIAAIGKFWSAKKQIEASREGRIEAMTTDLASVNQFALLDEKQNKEVEEKSKTIHVDKKEAKKATNASRGLGIMSSLKTIFSKNDAIDSKRVEFNKQMKEQEDNVNSMKLTKEQELEAKKDKELIQTVVEKIDIASQDYAENAELATQTVSTLSLGLGGGAFALADKLLSKLKISAKNSKIAAGILGFGIIIGGAVMGAKIQKQASRVGRFKARQELLNNPEQLVYVDKEEYQNNDAKAEKDKKKGFFANLVQIFKDNKEYNAYIKENNTRDIQLRKAKDQIELTDSQKARAGQLQNNVFKMFNKLDEKSQRYSEATEAFGGCVTDAVSLLTMIPTMIISAKASQSGKMLKIADFAKILLSTLPAMIIDIIVTKEQRNASRIANMQAIKELDDYRHFGDSRVQIKNNGDTSFEASNKQINPTNLSPMLQKMIKK